MGGSSKQVTGYRYFANFLLFIGNPIEKLLGINFDNRGWLNPLVDENGDALAVGTVNKPSLYGENEGGVSGQIHARYGTANPEQVSFYANYLADNDLPPLAYPYQSYLAFTGLSYVASSNPLELLSGNYGGGFYLGNSGYMKEMLLWPKRIHVKNDGSAQWYDEKAELANIYYAEFSDTYKNFSIEMVATCYWSGTDWFYNEVSGEAGAGYYTFPMYEQFPSYNVQFLGGGEIGNGDPLSVEPSLLTSAPYIASKNMSPIDSGTALPVVTWQLNALPDADNWGQGSIVRHYKGSGIFYWSGGTFAFRCVSSANGAIVKIYKDETQLVSLGSWIVGQEWIYHENEITMEAGFYRIEFDIGDRYSGYAASRPLIHLEVKHKGKTQISSGDINPIHKIREILTDDTAMNKPESDVNDVNFRKAADQIFLEGLGISWAITEKSCLEAINELCSHIEAGIRINRQTGLYEMVLFRDDWFEESEIHTLAENKIKSMSFEVRNADEEINQLNVSFYDRENIKDASFSIYENASIKNLNGRVNAEDTDFPYFMNQRNAAVVAQWKLKQFVTPCWKGTFTTGLYEARKWNRYDIVKINWSRKGIMDLPVRIMSINLGDGIDNTVSIEFVEVVPYSDTLTSSIIVDDKVDTSPLPPQSAVFKAFELSYFEAVQSQGQNTVDSELAYNSDVGYVAVFAQRPQNNSLNALLYTDAGAGYENSATVQYCETAELDQAIDRVASTFVLKSVGNIDDVRIGSQIFINDEIMVYQAFDSTTKVLTVKRGALDTVPHLHAADSVLHFADDFVSTDPTEYTFSEIVNAKVVTTTPSGVLDLDDVDAQSVEIRSRGIRPYPPANVKINSLYYPEEVSGNPVLTWVNRNRSQQTGGDILGWFGGGVTLESGVTYQLIVTTIDASNVESAFLNVNVGSVNTYTIDFSTAPSSAKKFKIVLKSVRDSYESMQHFEHIFVRPLTAPTGLTATYNA